MTGFNVFMPIMKVDTERRTVSGYATTEAEDSDGEIIELQAVKKALPDYLEYGNIREMHALKAVGVAAETNMDKKGLYLTAHIADDAAWKKCVPTTMPDGTVLPPVYKGFSIGGRKLKKSGNRITGIEMTEISIVDRPANPECRIDVAKSKKTMPADGAGYLLKIKAPKTPQSKALIKLAQVVEGLAKAGPPAAHDGFSLPAPGVGTTISPDVATTGKADASSAPCEKHGKIGCEKCEIAKKLGDKHDATKPYGDVEYADTGLREDGKHRYPIDNEAHVRAAWNYINKPKNASKYPGDKAKTVKAKIVGAWKKHIHADGPPGAENAAEKPAKKANFGLNLLKGIDLPEPEYMTLGLPERLGKSMSAAGSLAYTFDSLRNTQRSLIMEGKREGGDKKDQALAATLGELAEQLAGVISQKATHEGAEARNLTDADDQYLVSFLGEEFTMADGSDALARAAGGDPIASALLDMVKRAAQPTRLQRAAMAEDDVKKARKAMKMAKAAVEECHKLHKAAFLAKMAKADKGKKTDDDDGEFDHAGAMEKLHKAYQEIDKARTFGKAAMGQIAKMAGRSGQRGQEAGDAEAGFYEVPAGVKDLSTAALAGAAPGTTQRMGEPPMYPDAGQVYAGKSAGVGDLAKFAKNGQVDANVAALIMEKARTDGELEALRRLPAASMGGRRPVSFDPRQIAGGGTGRTSAQADLHKAVFDGVDINAMNGQDEAAHTAASARAIGNFLTSGHFAKSVFDPAFAGGAGGKED